MLPSKFAFVSSLLFGSISTILALLPRCPNTIPDTGNDNIIVTPSSQSNNKCAYAYYESDMRLIGGGHLKLFVDPGTSSTCDATYKWTWDSLTVDSGFCKSYYVEGSSACLSGCGEDFDCYVNETPQSLDFPDCASAAGMNSDIDPQPEELKCYKFRYPKGNFREDPPIEEICSSSTSYCYSEETKTGDVIISFGGCAPFDNKCANNQDGGIIEQLRCTECTSSLCNPVFSPNSGTNTALNWYFRCGFAALLFAYLW